MENPNIKKRRPYCREEQSSTTALTNPSHINISLRDQASSTATVFNIAGTTSAVSTSDPFPTPEQLHILNLAANILNIPVQKIIDLRVAHGQPASEPHHQGPAPHLPQGPLTHQPQEQIIVERSSYQPPSKRLRVEECPDNSTMFGQRPPQMPSQVSNDVDEKSGETHLVESSSAMTPVQGSYILSNIANAVTDSITRISLCAPCTTGYRDDYSGPISISQAFPSYNPLRPYQDARPSISEQGYDGSASTEGEQTPSHIYAQNPMDGPIQYMTQFPPMQPTGTIVMPGGHEAMVYPLGSSPMTAYFERQTGPPGHQADGSFAALNGPDRSPVTRSDGAQVGPGATGPALAQSVPSTPIGSVPDQALSGTVTSTAMVPARSMMPPPPPSRHDPVPSTPTYADNTSYMYGHTVYPMEHYPPYDMWPHGGRSANAKRGPFKSNADREKTAQTRRIGSCIRCRMQRIRCHINPEDDKGPCLTCIRVTSSKSWRLPCLRYKITDIQLFKPGKQVEGCEWTRRWTEGVVDDIANWASPEVKIIHVSEGLCRDKFVQLEVRRFIPQEGDKLERSWIAPSGERKRVEIPPYAICNTKAAKDQYIHYIDTAMVECFNSILGPADDLLMRTYRLALARHANLSVSEKERNLLLTTLRLWMSIRLTTRSAIIVGPETLGMSRDIMDATSPLAGKIPLPPVMGAQIDLILINQIQKSWRKDALEGLQEMIQNGKQKTWLTTYLVTLMMLHNAALITAHDAGYARKHGIPRRFARESMVGQYHQGANVLLAYWHYCNKGVFPFSQQCKDSELQQLAALDEPSMQFIRTTRNIVQDKRAYWNELQQESNSEDDYYFVSQLYEENWKPREKLPIGADLRVV